MKGQETQVGEVRQARATVLEARTQAPMMAILVARLWCTKIKAKDIVLIATLDPADARQNNRNPFGMLFVQARVLANREAAKH